jgi:hypothetical protein
MPSNLPDPSNIPDMSLGERSDKPAPPIQPDPATAYQPPLKSDALSADPLPADGKSMPLPARNDEPVPADWQEGDRVLAPWEPMFLYPGVIEQIMADDAKGDQALIAYDDGGEGWVFLYSLVPLEVTRAQKVHVRRRGGPNYFLAEVAEISGDEIRVRFDDGGFEWTTVAALRIPCVENGPGALGTKLASWQTPPPAVAGGSGIPSWAIWVGIALLSAFIRIGCRAMDHH